MPSIRASVGKSGWHPEGVLSKRGRAQRCARYNGIEMPRRSAWDVRPDGGGRSAQPMTAGAGR
jgi:hypothetical protein